MRVILIRERGTAALIYDYLSMAFENRAIGGGERERWYEEMLREKG